jgi:hypothetical protein
VVMLGMCLRFVAMKGSSFKGVGKTTLLLSATFRHIFIAIKRKNTST